MNVDRYPMDEWSTMSGKKERERLLKLSLGEGERGISNYM